MNIAHIGLFLAFYLTIALPTTAAESEQAVNSNSDQKECVYSNGSKGPCPKSNDN